jgi:hypothetical protein
VQYSRVQCSAVFYSADEYTSKLLYENIASCSKKGLGIRDISNLLYSNEIIDKLTDSDDSEFSDTDESSDTDFGEQEDYALLVDVGDKSGVGDTAYVSDNSFLWEDMGNYAGQEELFCGISRPQKSAKGLTNVVDIFKIFIDEDVQKIVTEASRYAEQFKNSRGNIFSRRSRVNDWQPVISEEIYVVQALFMLMGIIQMPSLRLYFSQNQLVSVSV